MTRVDWAATAFCVALTFALAGFVWLIGVVAGWLS